MSNVMATRQEPLSGLSFASNNASVIPAESAIRISLRAKSEAFSEAKKILGFPLPQKPKSSITKGSIHCLWIGPDEWLIIDKENSALPAKFEKAGNTKLSAVDVSHRNTAIILTGSNAENVLSSGCPQDLSLKTFPVTSATRTILGKAEVIIYRIGENEFRIECWRSFSDYVWKYLVDAIKSA